MRKLFLFLSFLFCFFAVFAQPNRVLFIGNSYTYVNSLPDLISSMYAASGEEFEYAMSAPGGCTFQQHCTVSLPYIQQGSWDYVVLQEQSQLPSFPDNQFMQESYPYAAELCSLIRQYNPNAHIVFYMTWGRKNGDAQNCPYFPPLCTYEGMDSLLYARYMLMSADNHTCVSPVGAAWHSIREQHPEKELYQSDESHPSYFGSYVAACSFYTSLTGRDPLNIAWNGTLSDADALIAKNVVKNVVYDSLAKWCFEDDTISDDSTIVIDYINDPFNLYPNPVSTTLHINFPVDGKKSSVMIIGTDGKVYQLTGLDTDQTLDVSRFPNGVYLLRVNVGNSSYVKSFIISH
jgi:hypothetical protein